MTDLIARLENAPEGHGELNVRIWAEIDNRDVIIDAGNYFAESRKSPFDECLLGHWSRAGFQEADRHPPWPHYTTSVDAGLTLVPDGWEWEVSTECAEIFPLDFSLHDNPNSILIRSFPARTPALALCIACMKVHQGTF